MGKKRLPISSSATSLVLPSSSLRSRFWFGMKVVISVFVLISLIILCIISSPSGPSSYYLEEGEKMSPTMAPFNGFPKVAFLFLSRQELPLDFLWHAFLQNADANKFSIYVHSKPGFTFDESTTKSSYFYGRQLRESVEVVWGGSSMVEAERLLFKSALEDPANQRFVLLSESCVPLYNFSYTYSYLMSSSKSFINSFVIQNNSRYNPDMYPTILRNKWRKGSQWVTLVRKHAVLVTKDNVIFPVFKKHCKQNGSKKEYSCVPDEHYIQTLFSINGLVDEIERRSLTYTLWNQSTSKVEQQGWHPVTFGYAAAGPSLISQIKAIDHFYMETEYRTEECFCNGVHVPCYLFARKFTKPAALRLLTQGVVGSFDPALFFQTSEQ
ncbi:glycosyltransferase BC10-like isoform X2 [Wolffia australiana]